MRERSQNFSVNPARPNLSGIDPCIGSIILEAHGLGNSGPLIKSERQGVAQVVEDWAIPFSYAEILTFTVLLASLLFAACPLDLLPCLTPNLPPGMRDLVDVSA